MCAARAVPVPILSLPDGGHGYSLYHRPPVTQSQVECAARNAIVLGESQRVPDFTIPLNHRAF